MINPLDIAVQTRCVNCRREQWALIVYTISRGEAPCAWCGHVSTPMTEQKYRDRLPVHEE